MATTKDSISKEIRDKIVAQAIKEMHWARIYKQGKVKNWQKNEQMYYGVKQQPTEARANVDLGRMQEFVHTLLSKIRRPLVFKYIKRKEAQLQRVKLLNAVRETDRKNDLWDLKDLVGKKQAVIYGRAIYGYHADSVDGYKPHLENIDVYDFLIDPSAGGIDIEQAMYMGNYGVVLLRDELEKGMEAGIYLKDETQDILDGTGNNTEVNQEETNKLTRMYGQNTIGKKELQNDDKFKFWNWYTTFEGERYYLVLQDKAGKAIRVEKLTDLFSPSKLFPKGAWPFWTWAAFPDLTEFWTPSYCDYVRELFMAQNVSINQMLDNAEAINKPQRIVNTGMIDNLAELKYRKDGQIKVKNMDPNFDVSRAYKVVETPSIDTPLQVFDQLEKIQEKASGVTADAKGSSDPDGKVGIYEGNKAEAADRFGLLDISYSFGYDRFARLHEIGIRDNLTRKVAIDITGPDGIETVEVKRSDLFKKGDELGVAVESSADDMLLSEAEKELQMNFISTQVQEQNTRLTANPNAPKTINPQKAFEVQAKIVGLKDDTIKELLDVSEYSNGEILAEAARDIESILNGEPIKPNPAANVAYMQKFVDWLTDHEEDLSDEQFQKFIDYMSQLGNNVGTNVAREIQQHFIQTLSTLAPGTPLPPTPGLSTLAGPPAQPAAPAQPRAAQPLPTNQPQPIQ